VASVRSNTPAKETAFSSGEANNLGRIDDAGLDQVNLCSRCGIKSEVAGAIAHLFDSTPPSTAEFSAI
jgi:hypothetical protein